MISAPLDAAPRKLLRVLHVEDSESDSALVMRELRRGGFEPRVERVDTRAAFKDALREKDWDVIISDYALPSYNGAAALADTQESGKDIPFILVSGTIGEETTCSRTGSVGWPRPSRASFTRERSVEHAAWPKTRCGTASDGSGST